MYQYFPVSIQKKKPHLVIKFIIVTELEKKDTVVVTAPSH